MKSGIGVVKNEPGWLQISTVGFASFNQARPPGHLVKELVQNAFDAIDDTGGTVALDYHHDGQFCHVSCHDTGSGIDDLSLVRIVYLTLKTDSHLKRGRFGRGFKEILSVAKSATVSSANQSLHFLIENGRQVTRETLPEHKLGGTHVVMTFDWPQDTVDEFDHYFQQFIVPPNVTLKLNGRTVSHRQVQDTVGAQLTTEIYNPDSHSWQKPRRKTQIELVEVQEDENSFIYEMGIPVAPAEWTVPFHANVLQRVPMNPNRDALASGFAKRIHTACLPTLLPALDQQQVTADWVGAAGTACSPEVQQDVIAKAFGDRAVRSVPTMGKRDFDDDAERIGANIVKTSQMSTGFREMAKLHLPSSRDTVIEEESSKSKEMASKRFTTDDLAGEKDLRVTWVERRGGRAHVNRCLSFAVWFCQKLVDSTGDSAIPVSGHLGLGNRPTLFSGATIDTYLAHWSDDNKLTLALECDCFWREPLGAEALSILMHEAAHASNMHHGKSFHDEVERLGGVGAEVMYQHKEVICQQWPELVQGRSRAPSFGFLSWLLNSGPTELETVKD